MVKKCILFLSLFFCLFLFGCNKTQSANALNKNLQSMEGYITDIKKGKILVVDPVPTSFSSSNGLEEFYNAIWFSNSPKEAKIGQKVQVRYENVLTSYPGQSKAKKVSIFPSKHPKNANLSEDEVIRRALKKLKPNFKGVTVIKEVKYNAASDVWEVMIKQDKDDFRIQVEDI